MYALVTPRARPGPGSTRTRSGRPNRPTMPFQMSTVWVERYFRRATWVSASAGRVSMVYDLHSCTHTRSEPRSYLYSMRRWRQGRYRLGP